MPNPIEQRRTFDIAAKIARDDAPAEIISGRDSLSDKARREIVGVQTDPVATPAEQRHVDRGKVLVEWVGVKSPLANDQIVAAKKLGLIPRYMTNRSGQTIDLHRMLDKATRFASTRWDGINSRSVGPLDGFNRTIRWGHRPNTYVQELTASEADRLFSLPCAVEFRYLEDGIWYTFEESPILLLPPGIAEKVMRVKIVVGPAERLTGIDTARPAVGYWT